MITEQKFERIYKQLTLPSEQKFERVYEQLTLPSEQQQKTKPEQKNKNLLKTKQYAQNKISKTICSEQQEISPGEQRAEHRQRLGGVERAAINRAEGEALAVWLLTRTRHTQQCCMNQKISYRHT